MDGRMMLRCVVTFAYLGLIVSVTCNTNHDVIKQVRQLSLSSQCLSCRHSNHGYVFVQYLWMMGREADEL